MSPRRRATLFLGMLVALGLGMAKEPATSVAGPCIPEVSGELALRLGSKAVQEGRLLQADDWLRAAWRSRATRRQASDMLWDLERRTAGQLEPDEAEVSEAMRQLGAGFLRHETAHFIVLSDADIEWVRTRTALMERTRHQFYRVAARLGIPVVPHKHKLLCILIDSYEKYAEFALAQDNLDAPWIAGYYSLPHNRVVFYNDLNGPAFAPALGRARQDRRLKRTGSTLAAEDDRARGIEKQALDFSASKTAHETVHLLSFNSGLQNATKTYPIWLSEGLATCFEAIPASGAFGPEGMALSRQAALETLASTGRLMPLERLVTLGSVPAEEPDAIEQIYAQGHALFTHLYQRRRDALATYIQAFGDATRAPTPEEQLALFESCFGPIGEIEARITPPR